MQSDDQGNTAEPGANTATLQTTLFPLPESRPLLIRELLTTDQPRNRLLMNINKLIGYSQAHIP